MTPPRSVRLNGVEARDLGLVVHDPGGVLDAPQLSYAETPIPGRAGALRGATPSVAARTLTIAGTLMATSAAAVQATRDALHAVLGAGLVEIETARAPGRIWRGHLAGGAAAIEAPQFVNRGGPCVLEFHCADPYAVDMATQLVALATGVAAPVPLGTAASMGVVEIHGAATNPTLALTDVSGGPVAALGLTVTLGATETLVVDLGALTVWRFNGSTWAAADALLTSGDFFDFDPEQLRGAGWLTLSAGTGRLLTRRRWT